MAHNELVTATLTPNARPFDAATTLNQIGRMTVLAISGGRVFWDDGALVLPVGNGYRVRITLAANDTYTVERVFVRKGVPVTVRRVEDVYCDELSDTAYAASNFRSDREWGTKVTS
jgi:hypothetical protein